MRFRGRSSRRSVGTFVVAAALVAVGVAPVLPAAGAGPLPMDDPSAPTSPVPTEAPTTTPPTTVAAPTPTTASTSSTTSTTSTTVPGATLPPVDESTIEHGAGGYAATPAPLIPSAADDPLFHAALTVDDDLVVLSKAQITELKQIAATRKVAARAAKAKAAFEKVDRVDGHAAKHLADSRDILRAAALHAYAGFGASDATVDAPEVDTGTSTLPTRTYVRVTIADATRHVNDATAARNRTRTVAEAAGRRNDAAQAELKRSRAAEKAAKKAVVDAKKKLARDRAILKLQIASMPDLAPGTLDRLPDDVKLPEGAKAVESPAGTIVVPASADPRTAVALEFIVAQIGKPYVWGATGPNSYDCSGLMLRGFQAAGVTSMPRVSQSQQVWATPVDAKDVQPGDLVFFGRPAYHVGVYIGGGLMIDAPYTGARVRVDRVWPSVTSYGRAHW